MCRFVTSGVVFNLCKPQGPRLKDGHEALGYWVLCKEQNKRYIMHLKYLVQSEYLVWEPSHALGRGT